MGKCADCKNCQKTGVPILLTRYAVAPANVKVPNANADIWATMSDEQGWMSPDTPPLDCMKHEFGDIGLGSTAYYTRRLLRSGFVYVFDEKRNSWYAWFVTDQSYCLPFDPKIFDGRFHDPDDEKETVNAYCEPHIDGPMLGAITIPGAPTDIGVLWIAFSDVKWTKAVFKQHQYAAFRARHMRKFDFKRWMGGSHPHAKKIDELAETVAEFSEDGYRGAIDFHFSSTPFNYRRTKIIEALTGKSGLPVLDMYSSEYLGLSNTRQWYKDFLVRPPEKPLEDSPELRELLDTEELFDKSFDIRYLGAGHPEKTIALDPVAQKVMPYIKFNSEAVKKQQIEVFKNRSQHSAIFTLDDPVGITSDLACLAHVRQESYTIERLKNPEFKRQAMSSAAIMQIKEIVKKITQNRIDNGEWLNTAGNIRADNFIEENRINEFSYMENPLLKAMIETMRYPTPEEEAQVIENEWKTYLEEYDEVARNEFEQKELAQKQAWEQKFVTPICESYYKWFNSYRTSWYMHCNFDDKDIRHGVSYTAIVSAMVADIQAQEQGVDHISKAVTSPAGWGSTNILLRALALNQSGAMEILETAQAKLAALEEKQVSLRQDEVSDTAHLLRVIAKLDDYKVKGDVKTIAEFNAAVNSIGAKASTDTSSEGTIAAWFATWNAVIKGVAQSFESAGGVIIQQAVRQSADDVLGRYLVQISSGLLKALGKNAPQGNSDLRRICTLLGALQESPFSRLQVTGTPKQAAAVATKFAHYQLQQSGQLNKLPAGKARSNLTRALKEGMAEVMENPRQAAEVNSRMARYKNNNIDLVRRFLNNPDIPKEFRDSFKALTGSDYMLLDNPDAVRKYSSAWIFDMKKLECLDEKTIGELNKHFASLDNPNASHADRQKAQNYVDRQAKAISQNAVSANDPRAMALSYTLNRNSNIEQVIARTQRQAQSLHDVMARLATSLEEGAHVQGKFAIIGQLAHAVQVTAAIEMLYSGNGRPFEGMTKLASGIAGMIGLMFERVATKLQVGLITSVNIFGKELQTTMIKTVGKGMGVFAGGMIAFWDWASAYQQAQKGRYGLMTLYFFSGALGFGAAAALMAEATFLMWSFIALGLLFAYIIMRATPDKYESWLYDCYFGKAKSEKFKSLNQELNAYKELFSPKASPKEEFVGGHANPTGIKPATSAAS